MGWFFSYSKFIIYLKVSVKFELDQQSLKVWPAPFSFFLLENKPSPSSEVELLEMIVPERQTNDLNGYLNTSHLVQTKIICA